MVIFAVENIAEKIETMEIRDAGKIARAAAKGLKLTAKKAKAEKLNT